MSFILSFRSIVFFKNSSYYNLNSMVTLWSTFTDHVSTSLTRNYVFSVVLTSISTSSVFKYFLFNSLPSSTKVGFTIVVSSPLFQDLTLCMVVVIHCSLISFSSVYRLYLFSWSSIKVQSTFNPLLSQNFSSFNSYRNLRRLSTSYYLRNRTR